MNRVIVVLLGLQLACDPSVTVIYRVSMQPAEADSIMPLSVAITDALTQRHLRRELGDTLATQFGPRFVEVR